MTTKLNDTLAVEGAAAAGVLRGDPDCNAYKAVEARVAPSVDPTAAVDVACFMTTDTVDADDEIVLPSGADMSRFEKNPVLLLCHGYGQPGAYHALPIGRVAWTKKRPNGILAGVKFAQSTAMGRDIKALFEEGMLRSFSIGFRSLEASPLSREEAYSRPDWKAAFDRTRGRVLVHRRWQLLELSAVPLPANPEALVASFQAKGRPIPSWLKLDPTPEARMKDETLDEAASVIDHDAKCLPAGQIPTERLHDLNPTAHAKAARPTDDEDEDDELEDDQDDDEFDDYEDDDEFDHDGDEDEEEDEDQNEEEEEDVEDEEDDDDDVQIRSGDHVAIKAPHYRGVGVVKGVHTRGHVPDVAEDIVGTTCDPAVRVNCYKAMGDGHVPTEHHVGVRCAHLTKRGEPLRPPSNTAPSPATCGHESKAVSRSSFDPLPPLETLSDEELQRQALEALGRIPKLVDDAIARYVGAV